MDEFAGRIRDAIDRRRLAWLRRACMSYIVRKCEQLTGKDVW